MKVGLQPFRQVSVTPTAHSTALATTAIYGVLLKAIQVMPGTGPWAVTPTMYTETTITRVTGILFVVCEICKII